MRRIYFVVLLILVCGQSFSQSVKPQRSTVGVSGMSKVIPVDGKSVFISQIIGQGSVSGSVHSGTNVLHQGYLQPWSKATPIVDRNMAVTVYPNPFGDQVTVQFDDFRTKNGQVTVFDVQGRKVHLQEFAQATEIKLNLHQLPSGLYLVEIRSEEKVSRSKIIKK